MSKGIKMKDCRFYVDEAARTVVCVVPNTKSMFVKYIRDHFQFPDMDFYSTINFWTSKWHKSLNLPNSFMGKAVCAKEDEWNEETGKLIAFARAKDKCYKSFFKRANTFVQKIDMYLGDMIEKFNAFGQDLEVKKQSLQKQIDEITGAVQETEE